MRVLFWGIGLIGCERTRRTSVRGLKDKDVGVTSSGKLVIFSGYYFVRSSAGLLYFFWPKGDHKP